jgi:hypothetical protein
MPRYMSPYKAPQQMAKSCVNIVILAVATGGFSAAGPQGRPPLKSLRRDCFLPSLVEDISTSKAAYFHLFYRVLVLTTIPPEGYKGNVDDLTSCLFR